MALQGWTRERRQRPPPNPIIYVIPLMVALVMVYVLAMFIHAMHITTPAGGAGLGLLAAIGFVATVFASNYMFGSRPWKLYLIDAGFYLVALVLEGALLGWWR